MDSIPRGKLHADIEKHLGRREPRKALVALGRLLHEQGFDAVDVPTMPRPAYEVRALTSCKQCKCFWLGTKAGEIFRVGLDAPFVEHPSCKLQDGVRCLLHVCDGGPFGAGSLLFAGTDEGYLHALRSDDLREEPRAPVHVATWSTRAPDLPLGPREGYPRDRTDEEPYLAGITALALCERGEGDRREDARILFATRRGTLGAIAAAGGTMRLAPAATPGSFGWVQWMVHAPGRRIFCVSRSGEIACVAFDHGTMKAKLVASLSVLPTAATHFRDGLLLGTTEGLVYWNPGSKRNERAASLMLPVTRSAVLCLDGVTRVNGHDCVLLGLTNKRLRAVGKSLLNDIIDGRTLPLDAPSYATDVGASVLEIRALDLEPPGKRRGRQKKKPPRAPCFVLAALRDHSLRLFQVDRHEDAQTIFSDFWRGAPLPEDHDALRAHGAPDNEDRAKWNKLLLDEKERAKKKEQEAWVDAVRYLLLDLALEHAGKSLRGEAGDTWLSDQVRDMVREGSLAVRRYVSRHIGSLAGGDARLLIRISMELLRAMPRDLDANTLRLQIEQHLKAVHAAARSCPSDAPRLIAWSRFVRKYVLAGNDFAEKEIKVRSLVELNFATEKYLDALIYHAQLYQRRYDLHWRVPVHKSLQSVHAAGPVVVAVTRERGLWFYDADDGRHLEVEVVDCAKIGDAYEHEGRPLALAVVASRGALLKLAVSYRPTQQPALGGPEIWILDLERTGETVKVTRRQQADVVLEDPGCMTGPRWRMEAHALCVGPNETILAGLDSPEHLFARVVRKKQVDDNVREQHQSEWRVDLVSAPEAPRGEPMSLGPADMSAPPPGMAPARAIAVEPCGHGYVVLVGSDDGRVRFVWSSGTFARGDVKVSEKAFRYPVTAIALVPSPEAPEVGCYIGIATGDVFFGTVAGACDAPSPIWREAYADPVVGVQLWRQTPLYQTADKKDLSVLMASTESGHVCIYETRRDYRPDLFPLSQKNNFRFRGMRLDRLELPAPLRGVDFIPETRNFVGADAEGRIWKGELCFTRDSVDRVPEEADPGPGKLPATLFARFNRLRRETRYAELFFGKMDEATAWKTEREIGELVNIDGGALRRYLLRERLFGDERWGARSTDVEAGAKRELDRLRPDDASERQRIKIVLKSLRYALLDPDLRQVVRDVERGLALDGGREHDLVRQAVDVLKEKVREREIHTSSQASRNRITAFREMFRLHVLRHAALEHDKDAPSIQDALAQSLTTCLRDDDRLVRVEALRAVAVTLHNVRKVRDRIAGDEARRRFMDQIFPFIDKRGSSRASSIAWLVKLLADNLTRYPDFTKDALISTAWYYVAALEPIFLLFPEEAPRLCEGMTGHGVLASTLEVLVERLERLGPRAPAEELGKKLGECVTRLYVVPASATRNAFIDTYKVKQDQVTRSDAWLAGITAALGLSERSKEVATRVMAVHARLAALWSVDDARQLADLVGAWKDDPPRSKGSPTHGIPRAEREEQGPVAIAEKLVLELHEVAEALAAFGPAPGVAQHIDPLYKDLEEGRYHGLNAPLRQVARSVLAHWRGLYDRSSHASGAPSGDPSRRTSPLPRVPPPPSVPQIAVVTFPPSESSLMPRIPVDVPRPPSSTPPPSSDPAPPTKRNPGQAGPLSNADIRQRLNKLCTDSDFDAFVLDHFPAIYVKFTNGMDRQHKTNLLIAGVNDRSAIAEELEKHLRRAL